MLGEELFLWHVDWFYVGGLFEKGSGNVGIDGFMGDKVDAVVDLWNLNAVILSIVFLCDLLVFDIAYICSLFYLFEEAVIESWSSL